MTELRKMGANVSVDGAHRHDRRRRAPERRARRRLRPARGAAMVIAGLTAEGTTVVEDIHYIERGYENFVGKLRALGADITLVDEPDEPERAAVS